LPRSKTTSFVTTIPLVVDSQVEKELLARFQAARQLYNACLLEAMVRMKLVKNSVAYLEAINIQELNGKRRWYVQLINEGLPYQKPQNYVSSGVVGLDLNVSNVAFVADNQAGLLPFADKVPNELQEIGKLQRKMQRSQRANNPNNYEKDFKSKKGRKTVVKKGKTLKGKRQYNKSKVYLKTAKKKRNLERKKSAYVKSQNRRLVNEILRHGNQIKTEKVSVKAWQKRVIQISQLRLKDNLNF
jgi:hypothetical protein